MEERSPMTSRKPTTLLFSYLRRRTHTGKPTRTRFEAFTAPEPAFLSLPGGVAQSLIDLSTRASFCLEEIASVDPVD